MSANALPCELLAVYRLVKTRPLFRNRGGELCHGCEPSKVHCSVPCEQIRRTLVLNSWYKEVAMNMMRLFSVGVVAAWLTCVSGYANASDNAIGESTSDVMLVAAGAAGSGGASSGSAGGVGSGSMDSGKRSDTPDIGKGSGGSDTGMKSGAPDSEKDRKSGGMVGGEKGTGLDSGKSGSAGPSSGMSGKSSGDSGTYGAYYGPTPGSVSSGTSGSGSGPSGGSGGGGK